MAKAVQDRIKDITGYFKGMQVVEIENVQYIYVIVQFPSRWIIDDEIGDKFNVTVEEGQEYQGQWYFCAEMTVGFDAIFDAIEYNVNKMLSAQERATLLQEKVKELQNIFSNETISLESLRTLDFTWKGKQKPLPPVNVEKTEENKRGRKPNKDKEMKQEEDIINE